MPQLLPFRALRYDPSRVSADEVVAPPYDVVGPEQRAALAARSAYNAIRVEAPEPERDADRYRSAALLFEEWERDGVLIRESVPTLYGYRMTYEGRTGSRRSTTGVMGALALEPPGEGDVLPHERTTPKARSDRLELLTATKVNTSPVWGLSMTQGLSALLTMGGVALLKAEVDGVVHEMWALDRETAGKVSAAVAEAPVVLADGHHRWETALAYASRQGAAGHGSPSMAALALIVELVEEELEVGPIHRLVKSQLATEALAVEMGRYFEVEPLEGEADPWRLEEQAESLGGPVLTGGGRAWLLRALPSTVRSAEEDLDSAHLAVALEGIGATGVTYVNSPSEVAEGLASGAAGSAVLLRAVTVGQISDVARARRRMPPKTTFFRPKPRTGMLFRPLSE
ncbi:MAG: DUF1015 domain-containing protein [Actinomycetota bacterium]|nr:DUF1015 domain-containing protein [Actinomycetota bacterium]